MNTPTPISTLFRLRDNAIYATELARELGVDEKRLQNVLYGNATDEDLIARANEWLDAHEANPTPFWKRVVARRKESAAINTT